MPKKIVLYARDEHKFNDMINAGLIKSNTRLLIGDIRDQKDLNWQQLVLI